MVRAGIFIGVDKTGNLQKLNDAASGAKRMHAWALAQGMPDKTHAKLITDADGAKVTPDQIYDAIKELIDGPGVDQLLVYFAGHGVNINRSEHWLLTDAPVRTSAAVNVSGSVELARYCGIGHVVILSDACRVAPEGIQAQNVRGVDIFPNDGAGDRAKPVDQFFACVLGRTAAEIKDAAAAATNFCALYTGALLDALQGKEDVVIETSDDPEDDSAYVRPVKLQEYLEQEIPKRVRARNLENKVNQLPDAILLAHNKWLSKVKPPRRVRTGRAVLTGEPPKPPPAPAPPQAAAPAQVDLRSMTTALLQSAMSGSPTRLNAALSSLKSAPVSGAGQLAGNIEQLAAPFGPDHFETTCGVKVRGNKILQAIMADTASELLGTHGQILRIHLNQDEPASVLLRFEGKVGTVIPAIPGFVAALTFNDDELVDIAYEPSANTDRWNAYQSRAEEVRALRAIAASASRHSRFRLDRADAPNIARMMQYAKSIDPTLALYAAYAYHDLQDIDRIHEMSGFLREDLHGMEFFDIALLRRRLVGATIRRDTSVVPFVPLFSQGWPLLKAHRIHLHPALVELEQHLRDSVWSLYDAEGCNKLEQALRSREVR